jgi:hypothetical protein
VTAASGFYCRAPYGGEPWLKLNNAAALLGISGKALRIDGDSGEIDAIHPPAEGPWVFSRSILDSSQGRAITDSAKRSKIPRRISS